MICKCNCNRIINVFCLISLIEESVPEQKPDIKTEKVDEKVPVASSQSASVKQPPEKKQKLR